MEPTLTEKYQEATNAILLFLHKYGEAADFDQIDRIVFYGAVDVMLLSGLLADMTYGHLLAKNELDRYTVAEYGREFMLVNGIV